MRKKWTMPERLPNDPLIGMKREPDDDHITIVIVDGATTREVVLSNYNATRLVGFIALFLGIPLGKAAGKIQLYPPGVNREITMAPPRPKTPGEALAQRKVMEYLASPEGRAQAEALMKEHGAGFDVVVRLLDNELADQPAPSTARLGDGQ